MIDSVHLSIESRVQLLARAVTNKMIEVEQTACKGSQYRNMRIATVVPEMLQGIWQLAVLLLFKDYPECPVRNEYSFRTKPQFVPFVFSGSLPQNLIVCDTRHMNIYQKTAKSIGLNGLFITSPKQMKQTTPEHIAEYQFVVVNALILKDLAKLYQQSVNEVYTDKELSQYTSLMTSLLNTDPGNTLQTVIAQLTTPAKMPVFVKSEARSSGAVFQRVVIDPSALNAVKHEILGKHLWIASCAFEFSPAQHTGLFWRLIRKFLPNRAAITDVNTRMDKVIIAQSGLSAEGAICHIYAKKKIKLPALHMPARMNPADFCNTFDIAVQATTTTSLAETYAGIGVEVDTDAQISNIAQMIAARLNAFSWLRKGASLIQSNLRERLDQPCLICYREDQPTYFALIPCCAQILCFDCFYKLLRQTLKCPTCRTVYASEAMISFITVIVRAESQPSNILISKGNLNKQLNDTRGVYSAVIDSDEPVAVRAYKLAQTVCTRDIRDLPLAVCIEEGSLATPQSVVDDILAY